LVKNPANTNWQIYSFSQNISGQVIPFSLRYSGSISSWGKEVLKGGDFNGDGKEDLMILDSLTSRIYEFNDQNNGQFTLLANNLSFPCFNNADVQLGDFNGDGKTDVFSSSLSQLNANKIGIFNGSSFVQYTAPTTYPTKPKKVFYYGTGYSQYIVTDLNNDGKSDLYEIRCLPNSGSSYFTPFVTRAQISTWANSSTPSLNFYETQGNIAFSFDNYINHFNSYTFLYGDFNGNGTKDILFYAYAADAFLGSNVYYEGYDSQLDDFYSATTKRISSIADGVNKKTTISYIPLTDNSVYTKENNAVYPLMDLQLSTMAVKKVIVSDGAAENSEINCTYSGAKMHLRGRGYMGNTGFTITNAKTNFYTTSKSIINTTAWIPLGFENYTGSTTEGLICKETSLFTVTNLGNSRFVVLPYQNTKIDFLKNVTSIQTFNNYDNYGNVLSATTNVNGVFTSTSTMQYENLTSNNRYLLGRLTSSINTSTRQGETPFTKTTTYTYQTNSNLITEEIIEPTNDKGSKINYAYNTIGMLTQKSVSPLNPTYGATRYVNYEYDPKFRFATKEIINLRYPKRKCAYIKRLLKSYYNLPIRCVW